MERRGQSRNEQAIREVSHAGRQELPRIDQSKVKKEARLDGKYLLRTSDDRLSPEDVALGYKQLLEVEDAFRTLKSTLDLRPMYIASPTGSEPMFSCVGWRFCWCVWPKTGSAIHGRGSEPSWKEFVLLRSMLPKARSSSAQISPQLRSTFYRALRSRNRRKSAKSSSKARFARSNTTPRPAILIGRCACCCACRLPTWCRTRSEVRIDSLAPASSRWGLSYACCQRNSAANTPRRARSESAEVMRNPMARHRCQAMGVQPPGSPATYVNTR